MSGKFEERDLFFSDEREGDLSTNFQDMKNNTNDTDLSFVITLFYFLLTFWDERKLPNPVLLLYPPDFGRKTVLSVINKFFPSIQIVVYSGGSYKDTDTNTITHYDGKGVLNIKESMTPESIGELYSGKSNIIFAYFYRSNGRLDGGTVDALDDLQLNLFAKIKPALSLLSFYYSSPSKRTKYYPNGVLLKNCLNFDLFPNCSLVPFSPHFPENGASLKDANNYYVANHEYNMQGFRNYFNWHSQFERKKRYLNPWTDDYKPIYNLELTNDFDSLYIVITIVLLLNHIGYEKPDQCDSVIKTYKIITDQLKNIKDETEKKLSWCAMAKYDSLPEHNNYVLLSNVAGQDDYLVINSFPEEKIEEIGKEKEVKSYGFETPMKILLLFILSVSFACMGSSVFLEASTFPCSQYLLTQGYILCFSLSYTLSCVCLLRGEFFSYMKKFHLKQVAVIGIGWATNYTFILLSASHLSNSLQVIIAQSQSILIAFVDYQYVGIQLSRFKMLCILCNVCGNMLAIGSAGLTGGTGMIFWCFIFLINAMASGLADLYSEVYMKTLLPPTSTFKERFTLVIALNMVSNLVGIFVTFLGIPLARYSVGPDVPLYDFSIFSDDRIWYWVLMIFSSYVYTTCAYLFLHSESSIFNAMCTGIGAFIQLCFFMTPVAPYNEIPPTIVIVSAVVVILSSLGYASFPEIRDDVEMKNSIFGKASKYGDLNGALGVIYVIAIALYLSVDTLLPLLPELENCVDVYSVGRQN